MKHIVNGLAMVGLVIGLIAFFGGVIWGAKELAEWTFVDGGPRYAVFFVSIMVAIAFVIGVFSSASEK